MFEKEFVSWVQSRKKDADRTRPRTHAAETILLDIGDDACVLAPNGLATVVTTDTLCDQVHFDTQEHALQRIGHKSVSVSISDLLAMGARPAHGVLTFFLPNTFSLEDAQQLYIGAEQVANEHGIEITGGDTNRYEGPLIVGSTLIGYIQPDRIWPVNGAQVGDSILVTGELGGSILGHHLDFQPRTEWVQRIAQDFEIHAATDISDSLSLDLSYLLQQSSVGGEIVQSEIPVSAAAEELSRSSESSALDHAMTDGEDFELIIVAAPENATQILASAPNDVSLIGKVVQQQGLWMVDNGEKKEIQPKGYIH